MGTKVTAKVLAKDARSVEGGDGKETKEYATLHVRAYVRVRYVHHEEATAEKYRLPVTVKSVPVSLLDGFGEGHGEADADGYYEVAEGSELYAQLESSMKVSLAENLAGGRVLAVEDTLYDGTAETYQTLFIRTDAIESAFIARS